MGWAGDCKPLLAACTPLVYRKNAFRITGLQVDASARAVKRRIDDLKHAEELGDAEEEHVHAFALNPRPSLEDIREAQLKLQDPECRVVEEFFWFWPMEWGCSASDAAICALKIGDKKAAYRIWVGLSTDENASGAIARHNLAIMYQLIALDLERHALTKKLSQDNLTTISNHWKACFQFWEDLAVDETFWGVIADHVRALDDERVTTGFVRRMRSTFPQALDKINAMLAIEFVETGKSSLARMHIEYMKATHQGLDDVPKILASITKPLSGRIQTAVEKARETAQRDANNAAGAARDMFNAVTEPLEVINSMLPADDHNRVDLCDAVAEAALECVIAFVQEARDWKRSIAILDSALSIVASDAIRATIHEHRSLANCALQMDSIFSACQHANTVAEHRPENGFLVGNHLLTSTKSMLSALEQVDAPEDMMTVAKDEVAGTILHCAIVFGNATEQWQACFQLLEAALPIAASVELKRHIEDNLKIVRLNQIGSKSFEPDPAPLTLSKTEGFGFHLFGASDPDPKTGSYVSTCSFAMFGIPLFPISRHKVIRIPGGYRFLGRVPFRDLDKWHLGFFIAVVALICLIVMAAIDSESNSRYNTPTASSTPSSTGSVSYSPRPSNRSRSSLNSLSTEIDDGKRRAAQMETELDEMDARLEDYERQMRRYRNRGMTDDYNRLVPVYNSLLEDRIALYDDYSRVVVDINDKVRRFNAGQR